MIFAGGVIHTMNTDHDAPEAVRCDGERITFTGSLREARELGDSAEVDLAGRCLMSAFAGYTTGGAHARRRIDVGSITPGKLADFAILDRDPLVVEIDRLPDTTVEETWVAGRQAWTDTTGFD